MAKKKVTLKDRRVEISFSRTRQVEEYEPLSISGKFSAKVPDGESMDDVMEMVWAEIEAQIEDADSLLEDQIEAMRGEND